MRIPFLDLKAATQEIWEEISPAVMGSLASGYYILGPDVERFEEKFAAYCGSRFCVSVGNGLDALKLSLEALSIGVGDEVIVPSNTFIATWLAVSQCGATIVPVEPNTATHLIEADAISAAITDRTRAILPVDLYGAPVDINAITSIARARGIAVVEDAAQAHGAVLAATRVGSGADAVTWSFYPGKNLGAFGDGGAITTNDEGLARELRLRRNYGSTIKYQHVIRGTNSRLDPVQATILSVKLKYLDEWNARRQSVADAYMEAFRGSTLILPELHEEARSSWHLFVVRSRARDLLRERLDDAGIGTLIHYPIPPHRQHAYSDHDWSADAFPVATELADSVLSLPIGPHMPQDHVQRIIDETLRIEDEIVQTRAV